MAEPKFTPGPWHISKAPTNGWPVTRTGDYFISSAPMRAGHYGDELADLNLIAAAPEVYEALERIMSDLPTRRNWLDPVTEQMAKAALAKARGEAQ